MNGCKPCGNCKEVVSIDNFHLDSHAPDGLRNKCKTCANEYSRTHHKKNREKIIVTMRQRTKTHQVAERENKLKTNYGLSAADYEAMLEQQDYKCKICKSEDPSGRWKRFHVDHCHETGRVRGLLCNSCNIGLGHFQDSPDLLAAALSYVQDSGEYPLLPAGRLATV